MFHTDVFVYMHEYKVQKNTIMCATHSLLYPTHSLLFLIFDTFVALQSPYRPRARTLSCGGGGDDAGPFAPRNALTQTNPPFALEKKFASILPIMVERERANFTDSQFGKKCVHFLDALESKKNKDFKRIISAYIFFSNKLTIFPLHKRINHKSPPTVFNGGHSCGHHGYVKLQHKPSQ